MDVGGDRPADRDVARPRRHGHEEAEGHDRSHERVEADPGVEGDEPRGQVEVADPGQSRHVEDEAACVLGGVAVTAAEAPGNGAPRRRPLEEEVHVLGAPGPGHVSPRGRRAAPAGEKGGFDGEHRVREANGHEPDGVAPRPARW